MLSVNYSNSIVSAAGKQSKTKTMENVNPEFIQPKNQRPSPSLTLKPHEIPVIDISSAVLHQCPSKELVNKIAEACKEWGFFHVINHGVSQEKREKIELAARQFFALPLEEKKKVSRDEGNPFGYHDSEHTKNVRDWKEIFDFAVQPPILVPASHEIDDQEMRELTSQWPLHPSHFREACEEYTQEMVKLGSTLFKLIACSLDLDEDRFCEFFTDQASFVRLNYYPPCPFPNLALGVGPHKDSGGLTILSQDDVGGLEVKRKIDGEWIIVKPIPKAYMINVGEVIQVWTNDRYESVEHRVKVNSNKGRLSIPMFINPSHYVMVKPLDELTDKERPNYKEYNYGKFLTSRRFSDFKKLNVETMQVHHFRMTR